MTHDRQRRLATAAAAVAVAAIVVLALVLTLDYASARARAPGEAARIAALQAQAQADASAARTLEAEHDRMTRARLARKARIDAIAFLLIAASTAFVASAKWRIALGDRRPVPPALVRMRIPLATLAAAPPLADASVATETIPAPDLAFVEQAVRKEGTSREAAIPILQAIQSHYRYLPDEALRRVCELTDVTPAQIAGTSSFYARFRRTPVGRHVVRVCHGTACHVSGARQITEELRRQLRIPDGADTDPERLFTVDEVACLGCCSLAPVLAVDERTTGRLTPATACDALDLVRQKVPG